MSAKFLSLILFLSSTNSKIIFERIDLKENKDYVTTSVSIGNVSGNSVLNLDYIVHKTMDYRMTIRCDLYLVSPKGNRLLMPLPKLNYCDIMRTSKQVPIVSGIMEQLAHFGNTSLTCPIRKGPYYLHNFFIDDTRLSVVSLFASNSQMMAQVVFQDENGKSPVNVFKYAIYVKYASNKMSTVKLF